MLCQAITVRDMSCCALPCEAFWSHRRDTQCFLTGRELCCARLLHKYPLDEAESGLVKAHGPHGLCIVSVGARPGEAVPGMVGHPGQAEGAAGQIRAPGARAAPRARPTPQQGHGPRARAPPRPRPRQGQRQGQGPGQAQVTVFKFVSDTSHKSVFQDRVPQGGLPAAQLGGRVMVQRCCCGGR